MRIAQIAPLHECVPPGFYGGTERVVSFLTEELVRQGYEVTLFAGGDSRTSARLVRCCKMALRVDPEVRDALPYHMIMLDEVRRRIDQFDILHFHIDVLHAPLVHGLANRTLTTLHGRLDLPDLRPFYATFRGLPLASISKSQQQYLSNVNWLGTVYHGLPRHLLPFRRNCDGYLAFLGRIAPEKRPDQAIEIAARSGLPLKIAAKVDRVDQAYWETTILPMIMAHPQVEFLGEIGESDKAQLLGGAAALLFPVDWPPPEADRTLSVSFRRLRRTAAARACGGLLHATTGLAGGAPRPRSYPPRGGGHGAPSSGLLCRGGRPID